MSDDDITYAAHVLETARRVASKTEGLSRQEYDRDENLRLALTHLLQVIGEGASRLSDAFCDSCPGIPWPAVVGMRHRIVHDYLNVDEDVVWRTATGDIPSLIAELERLDLPRD